MYPDDTALEISEIYKVLKTQNISPVVLELYEKNNRIITYGQVEDLFKQWQIE